MRLALVAVVVAAMALACGAAQAAGGLPIEVLDAGPAQVLGPGGGFYPVDITLKFIPVEYDQPIPTDSALAMAEGIGKYLLANIGADILGKNLNADEIAGGLSLPVVNTKVMVPVRAGIAWVGGVGTRPFLRLDLLGIVTGEADPFALTGQPAEAEDCLRLTLGPDAAMLVYAMPL